MNQLAKPGKKLTRQQLALSLVITFVSAAVTYFYWGLSHAYSALLGGCIGIVPNFVFALYAFKHAGASASEQVMNAFFKGVKVKMALTVLFFALCFKFLTLSLVPFFTTYVLAVVSPIVYTAATKFTFNQQ